jgi:4-hydroxybenzoate polyprenyltransferase
MTAIVLILISLLWSFLESPWFSLIILAYFLLNLAYSMLLKHKVVIDIIIVALCFVLRVIGGAVIIDVSTSNWLILCTLFISLFIGFSKRRNEIIILEDDANRHRKVLEEYSPAFLDQMISVVSALTIMSYALYTVSPETVTKFGTGNLIYTVPFVIYGIFRYFYLVYKKELGGSPTRIMYTDRPLIAAVFIWMITCSIIIYIK